ncbi:hydrogen peroxide-dependent heme synthase [Corynebacterium ulceribovis]|uniref:hydrogen peroxide-dependent heme synthase n=1 Tax=Corynebacterium ulceribovis TaxID=487732 RepID=UPI000362A1BE|nr:hydrogen peroxide-dependent heme synthase [Corynebacterium ulceribovis]
MAERLDFKKLNEMKRFSLISVFKAEQGALDGNRDAAVTNAREFFAQYDDADLEIRGIYDISGLRAEADFMIWAHAETAEELQEFYKAFLRETTLGQISICEWSEMSLHQPAEFNQSHLPSFIMGEEPGAWLCVYPFIRSYEWYLMEPKERRRILAEHGANARDFPDVRANTVPAFGLGDYEWILAFEAPAPERILELMYKMRYTEARLHVREEVPFFTGRRVADIAEIITTLP